MSQEYEAHKAREEAKYSEEYTKWVAGLSPKKRKELEEKGLIEPDVPENLPIKRDEEAGTDPAERPAASYTPDVAGSVDKLPDFLTEQFDLTPGQAKGIALWHMATVEAESIKYKAFLFQRVAAAFLRPGNVRIRAGALAFAANLAALNGLGTQSQFAKAIHVSRAALSKVVKWWQRELELPPSPHMKSEQACGNYSRAQKNNHWRKKKC